MTNEQMEKEPFQNGAMSSENSSGSDSDNFGGAQTSLSSCSTSSSTSSGTTSKLAARMADKVSLHSYPAEKRFKFEPNEDYLDQLLAMGISINGAKKALYYTGNRSVSLATNWIFDHPELDLETPLEEEMRRSRADELDDEDLEDEDEDEDSDEDGIMHHHLYHQHHMNHRVHHCHEEDDEDEHLCHKQAAYATGREDSDETDTDSEDFDEEDIPEFKMVFVVNTSLEMPPGKTAAQVGHAALGVQRVLATKAKACRYKVTESELRVWQDFGEKMVVVRGESSQHLKDLQLMAEDLDLPSFLVKDAGITQVPSGSITVFGVFGEDEDVNKITGRLKLL